MANQYFAHQESVKKMSLKFPKVFGMFGRIIDRHVGVFYKKRVNKGIIDYTPISINRKGMSDNYGILICYHVTDTNRAFKIPVHFEIETKTGKAKLSEFQITWRDFCNNMGIWWFLNSDNNDVFAEMVTKANSCNLIVGEINYGL